MVNLGSASAMDMYELIATARQRVYSEHGILLTPEVQLLGDWHDKEWPPPVD